MNSLRFQKSESEIAYRDKCSMAATNERAECVDAPCSDEAMPSSLRRFIHRELRP